MAVLSEQFQITAPGPDAVMGTSAQVVGPPGLAIYYYWWVAHYPIGVSVVSAPVIVRSAPSHLTATNYVIISGQPALGANAYDLLRTTTAQLPSGTANIAIAQTLPFPTFQDNGVGLAPYNIAGLAAGAPVSAFINLNNRDFAKPTLVIAPFGLRVNGDLTVTGVIDEQPTGGQGGNLASWHNYIVTLVPPNWVVSAQGLPDVTVPTVADITQSIPLQMLPPNVYVVACRMTHLLGPAGGPATQANLSGVGTLFDPITNPNGSDTNLLFSPLNLLTAPNEIDFADGATLFGNSTLTASELGCSVRTVGANVNTITPPCQFRISALWGVTSDIGAPA